MVNVMDTGDHTSNTPLMSGQIIQGMPHTAASRAMVFTESAVNSHRRRLCVDACHGSLLAVVQLLLVAGAGRRAQFSQVSRSLVRLDGRVSTKIISVSETKKI